MTTFRGRGPRGPRGAQGQASDPTLATPGIVPTPGDADVLFPPGDQSLPYPSELVIIVHATARRGAGRRDLKYAALIEIDSLGGMTIKGFVSDRTPVNSGGWTGTASLAADVYVNDLIRKLRVFGSSNHADATWGISCSYELRRLL